MPRRSTAGPTKRLGQADTHRASRSAVPAAPDIIVVSAGTCQFSLSSSASLTVRMHQNVITSLRYVVTLRRIRGMSKNNVCRVNPDDISGRANIALSLRQTRVCVNFSFLFVFVFCFFSFFFVNSGLGYILFLRTIYRRLSMILIQDSNVKFRKYLEWKIFLCVAILRKQRTYIGEFRFRQVSQKAILF